jgi:hypothetical protein
MGMQGHTSVRHLSSSAQPRPVRSLGRRTQLMARGPDWRLTEGEPGTWHIQVHNEISQPELTWSHMLGTLRSIAETHGLRPVLLDLRAAARVAGPALQTASSLFAEFERRSLRVATFVGPDLIKAARLHRVIGFHAPIEGRCFLTELEGLDWLRAAMPRVRSGSAEAEDVIQPRNHLSSRPHLCAVVS